MTEVWDSRYSKVVSWNGNPQEAPGNCETCDGTGRVYEILLDDLIPTGRAAPRPPIKWRLSTNNLPDDIECPECKGHGMVY